MIYLKIFLLSRILPIFFLNTKLKGLLNSNLVNTQLKILIINGINGLKPRLPNTETISVFVYTNVDNIIYIMSNLDIITVNVLTEVINEDVKTVIENI
jgi:hypothetical protein